MSDRWSSRGFLTFPGCSCISGKQQPEWWRSFPWREPCRNSRTSAPAHTHTPHTHAERKHNVSIWCQAVLKCCRMVSAHPHTPATLYTRAAETSGTEWFRCRAARTEDEDERMKTSLRKQVNRKWLELTWPKNKNGRRKVKPLHIQDWKPSAGQITVSHCC